MLCMRYGAKPPIQNGELVWQEIVRAHRYRNSLIDVEQRRLILKEVFRETSEKSERDADKAAAREDYLAQHREEYARSGIYFFNRLLVSKDVVRSAETGSPQFRHFRGDGRVGVEIKNGISTTDFLLGKSRLAKIVDPPIPPSTHLASARFVQGDSSKRRRPHAKLRHLYIRVGSEDREPIWAIFPFWYHRELPKQCKIKQVRVHLVRYGTGQEWSVQFILDADPISLPAPKLGTVAIDYGWRRFSDAGVRAAVWRDDAGNAGDLRLDEDTLQAALYAETIGSIRRRNFNEALARVSKTRSKEWPEWLWTATKYVTDWESEARLAALVKRWELARFVGDGDLFEEFEGWRRQDEHLYNWQANQLRKALIQRKQKYREFALMLARYREIRIEGGNLAELTEKSDKPEPKALSRGRRYRFKAAPGELMGCIAYAAARSGSTLLDVDPAGTTITCSHRLESGNFCGSKRPFDKQYRTHTCESCGATWDQDFNACDNILRAPPERVCLSTRSQSKSAVKTGETNAEVRRRRSLETRRARALEKPQPSV